MKCPMPRESQIITAAGKYLTCDAEADVITAVPVVNNRTGEHGFAAQYLCLDHSVRCAVWKLIERINAAQKERRIATL